MIENKWKAFAFRWVVADWDEDKASAERAFDKLNEPWIDEANVVAQDLQITFWEVFDNKPTWEIVQLMTDLAEQAQRVSEQ